MVSDSRYWSWSITIGMIYSGLVSVFSGFNWERSHIAKKLQPLTRDVKAHAIAKFHYVYTIEIVRHKTVTVKHPSIDLFHNGGPDIHPFIGISMSLSGFDGKYEFFCILHMLTRSERLIIIHIKKYINIPTLWKRSIPTTLRASTLWISLWISLMLHSLSGDLRTASSALWHWECTAG